ncbi:MAG: DUF2442 domain-containing protein [Roseiarcus sp.]
MAEFIPLTEAEFAAMRRRASKRPPVPRATAARFDSRRNVVKVTLDTGIAFEFDPSRAHGLEQAAPSDLAGVRVEGVGSTLHFPRLDVDLTVSRLLEGFLGPLEWTKREARAAASRRNGKLGGRRRGEAAE